MARNQEKAQSMLHRYLRSKGGDSVRGVVGGVYEKRRPYLATLCDDLDEAEKWHRQVESDIRRNVDEIQNETLGEGRVRDLNDKINKLLRERKHWRRRIVELGGRGAAAEAYTESSATTKSQADDDVFECDGYRYFGAARNLPGVREMVEARRRIRKQQQLGDGDGDGVDEEMDLYGPRQIEEMKKRVNAFYFTGFADNGDDSDKNSIQREKIETEMETFEDDIVGKLIEEWEETHEGDDKYIAKYGADAPWDESYLQYFGRKVSVEEAEKMIQGVALERKKLEALEQLGGEEHG